MYIRRTDGKIVLLDITKYVEEYDMYLKMWELIYNKKIKKEEINVLNNVVNYIVNCNFFLDI